MGRPTYKITEQDTAAAHTWIQNQLHKNPFWLDADNDGQRDFDRRYAATKAFDSVRWSEANELQAWCETWLRKEDWARLKTTIRAKRHNAEKSKEKKNINVEYNAWLKLSSLANAWDCTLSEAIDKLATPAYRALR